MSANEAETTAPIPATGSPAAPIPVVPVAKEASERRPSVVNTIKHGSVIADSGANKGEVRSLRSSSEPVARSFTDHQRAMLDALDKTGTYGAPAEPVKPVAVVDPAPAASPASASAAAVEPAKPTPDADLVARHDRLLEHNKRLVAELEQRKVTPTSEPDERSKALDEIERGLTTDSVGSLRKLVALNAGVKDPASPEVDRLMAGIYAEWTAHELKMKMDPAQQALIGTERNRLLIARDRREQEAAAAKAAADRDASSYTAKQTEYVRTLDGQLESAKHAEQFPLLMKHSKVFDGQSPGSLIFSAVRRGINAGEFSTDTPDATLINHYSKQIESHYQALRDQIVGAPTSTATPAQAIVPSTDKPADADKPGARTITNANASVAPAALPTATPPAPNDKPEPPKWRNEKQRRQQLAEKYFKD